MRKADHEENRAHHRIVIMPHGSKMQTIGVGLFAKAHQISQVFTMPRTYDPNRYSRGCAEIWSLEIGNTDDFVARFRACRAMAEQNN